MELLTNTNQLFSTLKKQRVVPTSSSVKSSSTDTIAPIMSRDAKALEFQLNTHLRLKYKQQSKVTLKGEASMCKEEVDTLMESFANKKKTKKTWKSLAMYEKWKLIQEYMRSQESPTPASLQEYQVLLREHTLDSKYKVEYDHETHKIVDIKTI